MFEKPKQTREVSEIKIEVGKTYEHEDGLKYRVDNVSIMNVTGYESGHKPQAFVLYTQLEAGDYSAGQEWVREKNDFLAHFKETKDENN